VKQKKMIKLKINNNEVSVEKGTSVLNAAKQQDIEIPSMCYNEGYSNHPSCMVCMVKDAKTGKLFPSCAIEVTEGMEVITDDEEVKQSRKEALELLLSDHVGDCEAPCVLTCPAGMNIPLMNRLIVEGKFKESLQVVKEEIAIPLILGYICPAPCEKACRRGEIDDPVSICLLKKFVAAEDLKEDAYLSKKQAKTGKKVAIIGSGPGGLSAAFYLLKFGHDCTLFDKNAEAGGTLRYEILENQLPKEALDKEVNLIKNYGAEFKFNTNITKEVFENELLKNYDAVVIASGEYEGSVAETLGFNVGKAGIVVNKDTQETNLPGVFACGSIIRSRRMAINSAAQAKVAAESADAFLRGEVPKGKHRMFNSKFSKLTEPEFEEYLKESIPDARVELENDKMGDFTIEQAILEAKRCLHCDCRKIDNCKLRIYSDTYEADRKKFDFGERKVIKKFDQHESVIYEPEKCIRCNLCTDITKKNKELTGLSSIGRGFSVEINIPFSQELSKALTDTAIECVESCPTGALAFKLHRDSRRKKLCASLWFSA
jgi:NADPH-dependent glutamate synthase beta subunit-like oxidoreductase